MNDRLQRQVLELKKASLEALQKKHGELSGQSPDLLMPKSLLLREIIYKLQEQTDGALSGEAEARINELLTKYDPINNKALRPQVSTGNKDLVSIPSLRDKRLPIPGTVIKKNYKGQEINVMVLEKGFEYKGKHFRSLGAIVEEITGAHWNGFSFFGL